MYVYIYIYIYYIHTHTYRSIMMVKHNIRINVMRVNMINT